MTRRSITRRRWLGRSGAAAVGIGTFGRANADDEPIDADEDDEDDPDDADELPLFDAHTHLIPDRIGDRAGVDADQLVDWMDEHGIDRAVVLTMDSPEAYPVTAPPWWVLEEADRYPDRLVPFVTVDPRRLVYGEETVAGRIEEFVDRGAAGFGELKVGLPIDDDRLHTVYEQLAEHGLPLLIHTDRTALTDEVGLPGLESILASYPEMDLLAHARGWWAHVSADVTAAEMGELPDRSVESGGRVDELLSEYDNLYGDLSAASGWTALTRDETWASEFLDRHAEQLVFGSDYLTRGQSVPQLDLFERFDLDERSWRRIRHENVEEILR